MSDFTDIQNLIRLKRHEQPSPEFVEEFLRSFQERQRAEMLQRSARSLLWERITTYFDGLLAPKWGWAAGSAAALVGAFAILQATFPQSGGNAQDLAQAQSGSSGKMAPISQEEYKEAVLIGNHFGGGFGDELETQFQTADTMPRSKGNVLPAGGGGVRPMHGFKLDIQQ